ncbi:MAG: NADH:flavin oxidoreductase [Myxococcota bacterium]
MHDLDRPYTLRCGLRLPNRAALAPLTNGQSNADGTLAEDELHWLLRRAQGGFGLVPTCAAYICDEGKAWDGQLGIASDAHMSGLTRLARALNDAGTAPIVQLYHGGSQATLAPGDRLSTVDADGVRGATEHDIERVTHAMITAACRASDAGFSGVELHGANGYLFTQFLAPEDNPRTDAYGGDLAGRARFLRHTLRAVRAAVPADFAVGVRISPVDVWTQRGLVLDDGVQVAAWMGEDGADWVHLSLSDATGRPAHEADAPVVATAVRQALDPDVMLMAAGGIGRLQDVERAMNAGIDVVAIGRAGIRHADWPRRVTQPDWAPAPTPWSLDALKEQAVGDAFLGYLRKFRGLVEGGRA